MILISNSHVTNLGTRKDPTTFRVGIYAERFLRDDFLGEVVLPIVNFADSSEYKLKLPLVNSERWDGDVEGDVELMVHFSVCPYISVVKFIFLFLGGHKYFIDRTRNSQILLPFKGILFLFL